MSDILKEIKTAINDSLGNLDEAYVTQAKKFKLNTESLSTKAKNAAQEEFEETVEAINRISAELDGVDREVATHKNSAFRRLKLDESYNVNDGFLRALHFENISDVNSTLMMDMLPYLRLSRDFGTFEDWQKDFVACAMSARNGYVVTMYSFFLKRYINVIIDDDSLGSMVGGQPIIVLDVADGMYRRDYLNNRKAYIFKMMAELNWERIQERIVKVEKAAKFL